MVLCRNVSKAQHDHCNWYSTYLDLVDGFKWRVAAGKTRSSVARTERKPNAGPNQGCCNSRSVVMSSMMSRGFMGVVPVIFQLNERERLP